MPFAISFLWSSISYTAMSNDTGSVHTSKCRMPGILRILQTGVLVCITYAESVDESQCAEVKVCPKR